MLIELEQVHEEPFEWHETQEISPAEIDRDALSKLSPVELGGRITFADPGFYMKARLAYEQTLECDRCLASYAERVDDPVELLLVVDKTGHPAAEGEGEVELGEGDLGVVTLAEEKIDTRPLILEQIQLNIPMKPLCKVDCKGICPRCGVDRNTEECACEVAEADPRWQGLAGLKARLQGEGEQD